MDYEPVDGRTRGKALMPLLLMTGVAFLAGIAVMAWLVTSWNGAGKLLGMEPQQAEAPAPPVETVPEVEPAPEPSPSLKAETQRLVIDPETTRRVNRLEQRVVQIDQQSRSAVGNADRAEGLLVAFAARRALDRGVPLGYLESLLRQRFGNSQPAAVATIITAARRPVTLEDLQEGLQEAAAPLTGTGPDRSWWTAFRHELAGMVTVRKSGTPSTQPAERLARAQRRLDAGQVDVALAEVLRMPGRENASAWIANARRYVSARRALDTIETAALLEPRAVQQPRVQQQPQPAEAAPAQPKG